MSNSLPSNKSIFSNGHAYVSNGRTTTRVTAELDLEPVSRFLLPKKRDYAPQYANLYFCRLNQLRSSIEKAAHFKFGPPSDSLRYASRIVDAANTKNESSQQTTVIIGIVYREMKAKPSILASYDKPSRELIPPPPQRSTTSYVSIDDKMFLEDENGRCTLDVSTMDNYSPLAFMTGFLLALRGHENLSTGSFVVKEFISTIPAPQLPLPELPADKFLCIMSSPAADSSTFASEMLLEFLRGSTGGPGDQSFSASIVHLLIAGDIAGTRPPSLPSHEPVPYGEKERVVSSLVEADRFLSALASTLPVSIMPGENDATNHHLPQQPFHRCLLPSSTRNDNLTCLPNPSSFKLDGRYILATSGQNVHDMAMYEPESQSKKDTDQANEKKQRADRPRGEKVLQILKLMLGNRHIAPSCPDTLGGFPFYQKDPFVLENSPHIFLAGCQHEFASKTVALEIPDTSGTDSMETDMAVSGKLVRLLSIPKFDETGHVVLVNLRTLDCIVREFSLTM